MKLNIQEIFEELSTIDVPLKEIVELDYQYVDQKIVECRNAIKQVRDLIIKVNREKTRLQLELHNQQTQYDILRDEKLAHDPRVKAASSIADREAIINSELVDRVREISQMKVDIEGLKNTERALSMSHKDLNQINGDIKQQKQIMDSLARELGMTSKQDKSTEQLRKSFKEIETRESELFEVESAAEMTDEVDLSGVEGPEEEGVVRSALAEQERESIAEEEVEAYVDEDEDLLALGLSAEETEIDLTALSVDMDEEVPADPEPEDPAEDLMSEIPVMTKSPQKGQAKATPKAAPKTEAPAALPREMEESDEDDEDLVFQDDDSILGVLSSKDNDVEAPEAGDDDPLSALLDEDDDAVVTPPSKSGDEELEDLEADESDLGELDIDDMVESVKSSGPERKEEPASSKKAKEPAKQTTKEPATKPEPQKQAEKELDIDDLLSELDA